MSKRHDYDPIINVPPLLTHVTPNYTLFMSYITLRVHSSAEIPCYEIINLRTFRSMCFVLVKVKGKVVPVFN
jgi:hypothetical protein